MSTRDVPGTISTAAMGSKTPVGRPAHAPNMTKAAAAPMPCMTGRFPIDVPSTGIPAANPI